MAVSKKLELIPISTKFIEEGGYRGRIADRKLLDYDAVIDEVIAKNFIRMEPRNLKLLIEGVFETMIDGVLKDGNSRRLGDYFTLQLEVQGKFDGPGEQFDASKHKLALTLRPLKAFNRKPGQDGVTVYNQNAGPKVVIDSMTSVGSSVPGVITFGKDLVITGENLWLLRDPLLDPTDQLSFKYYSQRSKAGYAQLTVDIAEVNAAGTQMVISWDQSIKEIIDANPELLDPTKNASVGVMVGVRSRGGEATAKQQLHRAKAYFDTWIVSHPEYAGNFKKTRWGGI